MVKSLLSVMASALLFATAVSASAQGTLYLGYCDGQIAYTGTGLTGNNATIAAAIRLTSDQLTAVVGNQITAVNAGLCGTSMPDELTAKISATQGGEALATGTLTAPQSGWNLIPLTTSYTVTGEETELWVEYSYVQAKKLSVLSLVGETNENGAFIAKNGKYTDYSGKNMGSLSVEAVAQGESIPTRNLTITSANTVQSLTQVGKPVATRVVIRNNASDPAVNPVLDYSVNGVLVGSVAYDGTLDYRQSATLKFDVPTEGITEEGAIDITLALRWADGGDDQVASDNTVTIKATLANDVYYRMMVAEEGTGSWCGWCVRGIVGMKYMREEYFDQFIGIGVHNGDEYAVSAYDSWMGGNISGYPSALVNRDGHVYDPSAEELEQTLLSMDPISDCNIDLAVSLVDDKTLNFHTDVTFLKDYDATNYNVAYVVLEDQLPIAQHNYYSGGGNGAMGGFENEGSTANILLDDIARAIYPTPNGKAGIIPAQIARKQVYSNDYQAALPTIANGDNVWAAVLLIDNATKEIVQAAKTMVIQGLAGIEQVRNDAVAVETPAYDLQGRVTTAKGLHVRNGQVLFVR